MSSGRNGTWYEGLRQGWVDRAARRMYARLAADPASYRSSPSTWAATVLAAGVLLATAAFFVLLVRGTVHARGMGWVVVVLGWLVVIALRPRVPRLPRDAVVLEPADYPGIHAIARQMAAEVGVRPPRVVAVDLDFNAYVTSVGVPPRRAMVLGLPYFTLLSWPGRLGVLGHELGHLRGKDTAHGRLLAVASRTLAGVHHLLSPSDDDLFMESRDALLEDSIGFGAVLARGFQTVLATPFVLLWLALERLSLSAGQHREYLADRRAAAVVGTEAVVEAFYPDLEGIRTAAAAAARRGEEPFEHLARRPPLTDAQKAARLHELATKLHRADATHPPHELRIRLLESHPREPGPSMPSQLDLDRAEEELVRLRAAASKQLSQELRFGPYR